jgi:hypothetical protein
MWCLQIVFTPYMNSVNNYLEMVLDNAGAARQPYVSLNIGECFLKYPSACAVFLGCRSDQQGAADAPPSRGRPAVPGVHCVDVGAATQGGCSQICNVQRLHGGLLWAYANSEQQLLITTAAVQCSSMHSWDRVLTCFPFAFCINQVIPAPMIRRLALRKLQLTDDEDDDDEAENLFAAAAANKGVAGDARTQTLLPPPGQSCMPCVSHWLTPVQAPPMHDITVCLHCRTQQASQEPRSSVTVPILTTWQGRMPW